MTTYCTQADMVARFGERVIIQLTDRTGSGVIDSVVLGDAIADACAEIDGYLTDQVLPLASVPSNLIRIAADIAAYHLHRGRPVDDVLNRYTQAIDYLTKVSKGTVRLLTTAQEVAPDSVNTSLLSSSAMVYTETELSNW